LVRPIRGCYALDRGNTEQTFYARIRLIPPFIATMLTTASMAGSMPIRVRQLGKEERDAQAAGRRQLEDES
jgi:hypothetical protein